MKKEYKGTLMVLLGGAMWGCMGLLVRMLNALGMTSIEIAFLRVLVAFGFMLIGLYLFKRETLKIKLKDIWCFMGSGIVSLSLFTVCYFQTITLTSLSVAAVLLYTAPIFVMLFSAILFHEKMTTKKLLAFLIAFIGCMLVTGLLTEQPVLNKMGICIGVLSGIGYAMYSIFGRYATLRGYHSFTITIYTFLFAVIGLFPFVKLDHIVQCISGESVENLLIIIMLIFFVTVAPYILYTAGLQKMENGKAAVIASIEPVVATLLGVVVYQESLTISITLGMVLVLLSIVLINRNTEK